MPRGCSICENRARAAVDADLVAGRSVRDVAASHGLGYQAVNRHRLNHLPQAIRRAAREALARENAVASASQAEGGASAAPIANALPVPSVAVPEASPTMASAGRMRRRGMVLDPAAPATSGETVAPGPLATSVGADRTAPASAGSLDLHDAALGLQRRAMGILETAERDGDAKVALIAIREARGVLEHLSRLQERTGSDAHAVPLAQSQEWIRTRTAIVSALEPYPEARLAVAEALVSTGSVS